MGELDRLRSRELAGHQMGKTAMLLLARVIATVAIHAGVEPKRNIVDSAQTHLHDVITLSGYDKRPQAEDKRNVGCEGHGSLLSDALNLAVDPSNLITAVQADADRYLGTDAGGTGVYLEKQGKVGHHGRGEAGTREEVDPRRHDGQ